ncbi:DNA cytosine methyltransferase [Spiroplasma monobiae]|uniref:Cytosine-specific methyltransferase n=1 Tax=Spiroplasma monobiae MQ-1 TaxID=1336748 RepID=A0A2K9LYE5_SPISQ|nr:DNA cytosine methyltransferase [Spiroplasma monobiae]AUM62774.1 DNA (cytosine-5)-methyltransferase 1 [Spiroplasma monobiae MQ-1]
MSKVENKTKKLRVFEAFAGIGAQRKALEKVRKDEYEIVGLAEWYVPAIVMYQAIHNNFHTKLEYKSVSREEMIDYLENKTLSWNSKNPVSNGYWKRKKDDELKIIYNAIKLSEKEGNIFDIRDLYKRTLKNIDLLTYSFPCQDLSQQGIQKGMKRGSGTRSGLLWEIERALDSTEKNDLPKYLLMENVGALLHKKNEEELNQWKQKLESLGYQNSIEVLNAADFGSSQARRRVFMISTLNEFVELPKGDKKPKSIKKVLNKIVSEKDILNNLLKYNLTEFKKTKSNINKASLIGYSKFNSEGYVYDPEFTGPTLTASGANSRIKIKDGSNIRKMNSDETFLYMGFDSQDGKRVNEIEFLTENQKIFVCGNSISVEVLEAIIDKIGG